MSPVDLIAVALSLGASLFGAFHALLTKRDPRSAAAWVTLCLLFPLFGVSAYVLLGNNRIRSRAQRLADRGRLSFPPPPREPGELLAASNVPAEYQNLNRLARAVSGNDLRAGNGVKAYFDGSQVFDAMIEAIRESRHSVYLSSYIFEPRGIGRRLIDALHQAHQRGVEVRVLLDGIGQRYSYPTTGSILRKLTVPVLSFLPPRLIPLNLSINLRNHRKILLVDDCLAFTGGMNVRNGLIALDGKTPRVLDLHFRVDGPVVSQLREVFAQDWQFCGGQPLGEPRTIMASQSADALCRVIIDGPNDDRDKLIWVLVGAIGAARESIRILTPYFLPPRVLMIALQTAVLRGVNVEIVLPKRNNLRFMHWAAWHAVRPLIGLGIRVYFCDGPFNHSKLFLVDDYYVQIGSANLDPRSLRLNFEVNLEIYDANLGTGLAGHVREKIKQSQLVTREMIARRHPLRRVRDAAVWLFSPFL